MSLIIVRGKDREEWLRLRERGIGSSEVGTLLGVNPYDTPYQLWRRKLGMDPPKKENFAMRAGHYLEEAVSLFYRDEAGVEIIKASAGDWIAYDDSRPYMRASPDRTFWIGGLSHSAKNKGVLECKTTQTQVDASDLPPSWFCQLQYQLGIVGLRRGALAWLTQGREFGYRNFLFDPAFFELLADEVSRFWTDNIEGREEPPLRNARDVLLKYPNLKLEAEKERAIACETLSRMGEDMPGLADRQDGIDAAIRLAMRRSALPSAPSGDKP